MGLPEICVYRLLACLAFLSVSAWAQTNPATGLPRNVRPVICKLPTGADLCVNSRCTTVAAGVTACMCDQGTVPNQFSALECVDFDECTYYPDICRAGMYGRCVNELGDYRCECDSRYYVSAGNEHYCESRSFFNTPFGQFMWFSNAMGGMDL